jgi:uncharacterized membrane protein YeiB
VGELTPVPPRERVATLDVLRVFALLGVLLANASVMQVAVCAVFGTIPPRSAVIAS